MQRSIGVCFCWSDLEKRRKAIDLYVQRQLEVVDGIPKKVFYECGATPTNCKYNVTAVRNEATGHFELFEMGEHSHPIRANISSGILVDQTNPICPQPLTQNVISTIKSTEPSTEEPQKVATKDEKPTTKEPKKEKQQTSKRKSSPKSKKSLPPKKLAKLTEDDTKRRDSSSESIKSEMTSTTNSSSIEWNSKRKMLPRAAKMNINNSEKRASLNVLMSPCEPMTRSRARTLLDKSNSAKPVHVPKKILSAPKLSVENKSKPALSRGMKRCVVYSSSSSSEKSLPKNEPEVDILSSSSEDSTSNFTAKNGFPSSFRSQKGILWTRIATIFGDDALSKFQQINHMRSYKRLIWKCNLEPRSNEYRNNCQYMMRVLPKKDKNSNLYYVYFSGVHNPSCKKFQNEDPKLKDLKKTTSINHFGINEDKNDIQVHPKRQAAITASRKISGQNENTKKRTIKTRSLIELDCSSSEDSENFTKNSEKSKETSIESDDEPAAIFIQHTFNKPPTENNSNNKKSVSISDHLEHNKRDENLVFQSPTSNDLNETFPQLIPPTLISSSTPINSKKTPRRSLENAEESTATLIMLDNSPKMDLPRDWKFKLESVFVQMNQLAEDLHLKFTCKGLNLGVFSSNEQSQTGQVLVLNDQIEDDVFVKVSEFGDWKLICEEMWPKVILAGVRQFLYAVRGKLIEFFFVIPSSPPGGSEINTNDGKSLVSEINSEGTTTGTSSSVQFKRENTEDLSTVVSFEGDFVGKDKEGNLEISVERINQKNVDKNISVPAE
uniref:WRKY domain-containing protein n=1 Tax=Meloidogyne incognita TaxID=6306 RepID=A0A914M123_MELIC